MNNKPAPLKTSFRNVIRSQDRALFFQIRDLNSAAAVNIIKTSKKKLNFNGMSDKGDTLLMAAVRAQLPDVVDALLEAGARPGSFTPDNGSELALAAQTGNLRIINSLGRAHADPFKRDRFRRKPSEIADKNGHPEAAAVLRGQEQQKLRWESARRKRFNRNFRQH